jgi:hypothetical protein
VDVRGVVDLRQHHDLDGRARPLDHGDEVAVAVRRVDRVHPDGERGAPRPRAGGGRDRRARRRLGLLGDGVLQVEDHLVGAEGGDLRQHPRARPRDHVAAAPRALGPRH